MPLQNPIYRKSLFIALPLAFIIALAGVLLHDKIVPTEQPALTDRETVDSATTQDHTTNIPNTVPDDAPKPLPPELVVLQRKLEAAPPLEQEQEQSKAIIAKANALIEQTDALIADAGHSAVTATKTQTEQQIQNRITELRAKATELQARRESLEQ